jgi:hypothetical protein
MGSKVYKPKTHVEIRGEIHSLNFFFPLCKLFGFEDLSFLKCCVNGVAFGFCNGQQG